MIRLKTDFLVHFRVQGVVAVIFTLLLPELLSALYNDFPGSLKNKRFVLVHGHCERKPGDVNGQSTEQHKGVCACATDANKMITPAFPQGKGGIFVASAEKKTW